MYIELFSYFLVAVLVFDLGAVTCGWNPALGFEASPSEGAVMPRKAELQAFVDQSQKAAETHSCFM